ncbi:hypothetical protein [Methylotuvimicrobium buryatense]|uniref:Polymerase nucleotidyl transferase domain-containing protein n=1 Tax=Methylotuvimicrobium buryatense TaxID=95641 RepID=A0A4P9UK66_METBY|nr:hypothetical protein [Methylotuvimicrobium buryatense]QCW81574.1 hypothetical protein EQU24_04415 [Methylotuvimicrobium buryatense]
MKKTLKIPDIKNLPQSKSIFFLDSLKELDSYLSSLTIYETLIIHGSFGDFSFTEYSDLEITIVLGDVFCIKESTVSNQLVAINKMVNELIIKVDPLQHHGAFFINKYDISNYNESILPLCAYDNCWSLTSKEMEFTISNSVDDTKIVSRKHLELTLDRLRNPELFFRYGIGMYSIKQLLSNFLMVPVYYYQSKGVLLNKKQAIHRFSEDFHEIFNSTLSIATYLRNTWPVSPNWIKLLRNHTIYEKIPQNKVDLILINLYKNKKISDICINDFLIHMKKFLSNFQVVLDETRKLAD